MTADRYVVLWWDNSQARGPWGSAGSVRDDIPMSKTTEVSASVQRPLGLYADVPQGPEVGLGEALSRRFPVAVHVYGFGGSGLWPDWSPASPAGAGKPLTAEAFEDLSNAWHWLKRWPSEELKVIAGVGPGYERDCLLGQADQYIEQVRHFASRMQGWFGEPFQLLFRLPHPSQTPSLSAQLAIVTAGLQDLELEGLIKCIDWSACTLADGQHPVAADYELLGQLAADMIEAPEGAALDIPEIGVEGNAHRGVNVPFEACPEHFLSGHWAVDVELSDVTGTQVVMEFGSSYRILLENTGSVYRAIVTAGAGNAAVLTAPAIPAAPVLVTIEMDFINHQAQMYLDLVPVDLQPLNGNWKDGLSTANYLFVGMSSWANPVKGVVCTPRREV